MIAQGRRVESQSDYQAVLVNGHSVLERREIVSIDKWGSVSVQRLGFDKQRLGIAIAVAVVVLILIVIALAT